MNADNFAAWMKIQGHQVIRTESSYWFDAGPRVLQAFPYHWVINPSESEIDSLLKNNNFVALRYSTFFEAATGAVSYHAVFDGPEYNLEDLDRRSRQNVRKGLKNCRVEPIPFERLAEEGWELEKDTLDRQNRKGPYTKESWRKRCLAAGEIPGFEAWGAIIAGKLAATLLSFQSDDCCELIFQQCRSEFLGERVNNAVTYHVTHTIIQRPEIKSVFYTLQSLDAPPEIDEYKFRMNYKVKPVRQRVAFHPWLRPFVNGLSHRLLVWLNAKKPENHQFAKAEGLFRFYLQGKLPVQRQDWPVHLESSKEKLQREIVWQGSQE